MMLPTSQEPFPLYTHIPGVTPHPINDPAGHSFGASHPQIDCPNWESLPTCGQYQRGQQLFNAGYYWEAHEAWEGVWIAAGRVGLVADFVKGLIKLAAAGVKLREGIPSGVQRHLARADELLQITLSRLAKDHQKPAAALPEISSPQMPCPDVAQTLGMVRSLRHSIPTVPEVTAGHPVAVLGQL